MTKGILIKNASNQVVDKRVYEGEDITTAEKTRIEAAHPTYTVTIYTDVTEAAFANATIDNYENM